jgi:hypothetical protein
VLCPRLTQCTHALRCFRCCALLLSLSRVHCGAGGVCAYDGATGRLVGNTGGDTLTLTRTVHGTSYHVAMCEHAPLAYHVHNQQHMTVEHEPRRAQSSQVTHAEAEEVYRAARSSPASASASASAPSPTPAPTPAPPPPAAVAAFRAALFTKHVPTFRSAARQLRSWQLESDPWPCRALNPGRPRPFALLSCVARSSPRGD